MTDFEINIYKAAASLDLIPDEENPLYIFSSTNKELLAQIIGGGIDVIRLAKFELNARGLNENGKFVGFR